MIDEFKDILSPCAGRVTVTQLHERAPCGKRDDCSILFCDVNNCGIREKEKASAVSIYVRHHPATILVFPPMSLRLLDTHHGLGSGKMRLQPHVHDEKSLSVVVERMEDRCSWIGRFRHWDSRPLHFLLASTSCPWISLQSAVLRFNADSSSLFLDLVFFEFAVDLVRTRESEAGCTGNGFSMNRCQRVHPANTGTDLDDTAKALERHSLVCVLQQI